MPELPEVETIVRQLNDKVSGKKISNVEVYDSMVVDERLKKISAVKIKNVFRRAKSIIFELDDEKFLLTHLRMTGHFHYLGCKRINHNYKKFMVGKFNFSDGSFLTHNSIRKFGSIRLLDREQLDAELNKYGPEPLDDNFTLKEFRDLLYQKSRSNIKTMLMDPKVIAGIGNIYAQEALYYSGIFPFRKAGSLSVSESSLLYKNLREILHRAIKEQGCTVDNYSNLEGSGGFQNFLAVYGKEKCLKGHDLTKIKLGGRGTSYCGRCQK